ncbi:MAG: leucine-rich repeat domain-containing protein [Bacteroidales bacterium]|nr:leucine-rich repeat domain-containing protein [Bacteroidales bacterium]
MKKALFLTALMMVAMQGLAVNIDGINYSLNNNNHTAEVGNNASASGVLVIPDSVVYNGITYIVTSIGGLSFRNCTSLTSVTIPNSVITIGFAAFEECIGLNSVSIGNGVTSIGDYAFCDCNGLTSVTFPDSVVSIGSGAFLNCSGLTSVTIPNSVTTIGENAFAGCSGLTSVTIGSGVISIGQFAFLGCSSLTSVAIPNSVTSIGGGAFGDVRHIEYYGSATGSPWGAFSMNGVIDGDFVYFDTTRTNLIAYLGPGGAVTIPSTVDTINDRAFYRCTGLTSATIPNSVISIGNWAFCESSNLTYVTIGESVTSIGYNAFEDCVSLTFVAFNATNCITAGSVDKPIFSGCSNLTNITFGNNVECIPNFLCSDCTGLTSVTIPNGVTSIGSCAFKNCTSLTFVMFNADSCTWTSLGYFGYIFYGCSSLTNITFGNNVRHIPGFLCYGCSGQTSVMFNADSCISAGSSSAPVFSGCSNFTNITFGDNVKRIPDYLCYSCNGLTSITIPDSITLIGNYSFSDCNHLLTFRCKAIYPPSLGTSTFENIPQNCMLIVRCGSLQYYSASSSWNSAFQIMQEDCQFTVTAVSDDPTMGSATVDGASTATVYDGDEATLVATANSGYRFLRWNDNDTHAVRTVTVTANATYTAYFISEPQGIENISGEMDEVKVYVENGRIVVEGATDEVCIYDIMGRQIFNSESRNSKFEIQSSQFPAGVYMLKVGNLPARKVVVLK